MIYYIKKISCLFIVSFLFLSALFIETNIALAQAKKTVPTDITANSMRYSDASQTVVFEGNVHVKRPDFDLKANKITVFFAKKDKKAKTENGDDQGLNMQMQAGALEKIVALGNVKITKDDKVGTANQGTYYAKTGVLTMEGNPVIKDGKNSSIGGEIIKFYINENRSEILGGVKASFSGPMKEQAVGKK
ncbi:LptA/OstA family protein [Desulfovibrio litoralis]|uniref:Lipopolysaccharide export system protein LptA n=1 Tax=Desulfovibrio litoralis DSM 11393 TaxID=1121455 RepID=A0A1M7SF42_9BACT|nr:LptA/OstA family protein [Desulfovibrio litoralis]SHN57106.1 lipopolysaccharide export system protein LptA [Desulfovibrio litoralis DSM 11393]